MKFENTFLSRENRYWLGIEKDSGRHYAAIPVANGMVDFVESYWITDDQYQIFLNDHATALHFIESCRRSEHDDLLIFKPGTDRGVPV
ncbi:hypothetical protein [Mycobacterium sp. DL440]|uniref:hypothetical protein n=1 Tax=Mycobacterium sp. DL440 TaxID=2675523 RepID=UPI00142024DE|nr:hypothetical protein [Mycobacterium sp. DL440]